MAKQHTSIILRNITLLEVSASLHYKDEKEIERKDIRLLKKHANNITSISQRDNLVTIGIWFNSEDEMKEFLKDFDKLSKSN